MTNSMIRRPGMALASSMMAVYVAAFAAYVLTLTSIGATPGPLEVLFIGGLFLVLCWGLTRAILTHTR